MTEDAAGVHPADKEIIHRRAINPALFNEAGGKLLGYFHVISDLDVTCLWVLVDAGGARLVNLAV